MGVRSWESLAVWQDRFDFVWLVYFAVIFFINAAPPGRIFLTANDTKYTKGWMAKLPQPSRSSREIDSNSPGDGREELGVAGRLARLF